MGLDEIHGGWKRMQTGEAVDAGAGREADHLSTASGRRHAKDPVVFTPRSLPLPMIGHLEQDCVKTV